MGIELGPNRYGKAETRVVRIDRDTPRHDITDLNVSTQLSGDLTETHLTGDNANVLPTDTQKNTVYAFARDGIGEIEAFGLRLARHFVDTQEPIHRARVAIEQYAWERLGDHSFRRSDPAVRTATVTFYGDQTYVVSGVRGLVVLNSTDSEFWGFPRDEYTTLVETQDRILATEVNAQWLHAGEPDDWGASYVRARQALLDAFAGTYSYSLQQTLYAMGRAVLERQPSLAEIRLSLPNKHHFAVDLEPFGLTNPGEVFHADDRPYGLIEGTIRRDDVLSADDAW
jgi:urate oxidase